MNNLNVTKDKRYYDFVDLLAKLLVDEDISPLRKDVLLDMIATLILNDNTYDYESYVLDHPNEFLPLITTMGGAHFPDKYKTVYHPTFSNLSLYSGKVSEFNPFGIEGGTWLNDYTYLLSPSLNLLWDRDRTLDYLREVEKEPVTFKDDLGNTIGVSKSYAKGGDLRNPYNTNNYMGHTSNYDLAVDSNGFAYYKLGDLWIPSKQTAILYNLPYTSNDDGYYYLGKTISSLPNNTLLIKAGDTYWTEGAGEDMRIFPKNAYDWEYDRTLELDIEKSRLGMDLAVDALKLLDPTGILSWKDARKAINAALENPSVGRIINAGVETLGALPLVGKTGKLLKLGKFGNVAKPFRYLRGTATLPGKLVRKPMDKVFGTSFTNYLIGTPRAFKVAADADDVFFDSNGLKAFADWGATRSGGDLGLGIIGPIFYRGPLDNYTGTYDASRSVGYEFSPRESMNPVALSIYGEGNFLPYVGEPLQVNGKVLGNTYMGNILPFDTLRLPESYRPLMKEMSGSIMNGQSDYITDYQYGPTLVDAGGYGIGVGENKLRAYDIYDFDDYTVPGRVLNNGMKPNSKYPNAGAPTIIQDIPIKYVPDSEPNDVKDLKRFLDFKWNNNNTKKFLNYGEE